MEESHKRCRKCGVLVSDFSPSLFTIMKLQKALREQHISKILEMEACTPDEAEEWILHNYHGKCEELIAYCPYCSEKLKTWRAKQCLHCLRSWHDKS